MIANHIIQGSITELSNITRVDMCVIDLDGTQIASTYDGNALSPVTVRSFIDSGSVTQTLLGHHLFRVMSEGETVYVLMTKLDDEMSYTIGRVATSQIQSLVVAYRERFDTNNFFQSLLLDNMLLIDIYNKAKKLQVPIGTRRTVFLIESTGGNDSVATETLKGLFSEHSGDYVTAVDEKNTILIKTLTKDDGYDELYSVANTVVDMMNTEAMVKVRVAYGTIVKDLKDLSKSYKEALMALDVGKIFYEDKSVVPYNTLGIGRLIYQLPTSLCELFMKEVFGEKMPDELDEEVLITINKFFENSLNVSETSRQLFVHRNTLVYRIEKVMKATGLDVRNFEDALTLKIALMVVNYMDYLKEKGEIF